MDKNITVSRSGWVRVSIVNHGATYKHDTAGVQLPACLPTGPVQTQDLVDGARRRRIVRDSKSSSRRRGQSNNLDLTNKKIGSWLSVYCLSVYLFAHHVSYAEACMHASVSLCLFTCMCMWLCTCMSATTSPGVCKLVCLSHRRLRCDTLGLPRPAAKALMH